MIDHALAREFAEAVDGLAPVALRTAATLRIADHLEHTDLPLHVLAQRTHTDAALLARLMAFLTCRGVFAEPTPATFTNSELSQTLLDRHPAGLRRWLDNHGVGAHMDRAINSLEQALRTGRSPYEQLHGKPYYTDLAAPDAAGESFDLLRHRHAASYVPELVQNYPWPPTGHIVDIGGGTGVLIDALLRRFPNMSATLQDLPAAVATGMHKLSTDLVPRCTPAPGNFFDTVPPDADVYTLVNVLHNWDDTDATTILRNCAAATPTAAIVVVERLTHEGDRRALTAMHLRMFLFLGGRERSLQDYQHLASAAGLHLTGTTSTPSGLHLLTFHPTQPGTDGASAVAPESNSLCQSQHL